MKKLLIRLSAIPLFLVLGCGFVINFIYWLFTGEAIEAQWLENWLNAVEREMV